MYIAEAVEELSFLIEISTIAPEYSVGNIPILTASVAIREPRIAPKVSKGISVPPVTPVFVEMRSNNARISKSAISMYHTGACE